MSDVITGDPTAAPPTPAELAANPDLAKRHVDFGEETGSCDLEDREFQFGEPVVIEGKTIVQDKERRNEGMTDIEFSDPICDDSGKVVVPAKRNPNYVPLDKRELLEADVTGAKGVVTNGSYWSDKHQDEMVPVETSRGGLLYVPSKRLERQNKSSKFAIAPHMTDEDRKMATDMKTYMAAQSAAFLEHLPFPTFTDWLALRKPKE